MKIPKATRLPSGSYNVRLRLGGEEISVTELSEQEAVKKARLIKAEYLAGKRERKADEASLTLGAAIDLYCADRSSSLSPATVRKYKNIKANHWPGLMTRRLDQITKRQWQTSVNDMLASYAAKTVKVSLGMTKSVVLACGVVFPDVAVGRSSAERARDIDKCKFLEPEEIRLFVAEAVKTPYAIPLLLALSSLRMAEIDGLDWTNVVPVTIYVAPGNQFVQGPPKPVQGYEIRVRRVKIKDENNEWVYKEGAKTEGSVRDVPIFIPQLAEAIERERKPEGKVMTCCQEVLRRACQRVCDAAGVPCPGVHGLRHSFASLCASEQVRVPELISQQIGGWENDKIMKEIYTHVAKSDLQASLARLRSFYKNDDENADAVKKT